MAFLVSVVKFQVALSCVPGMALREVRGRESGRGVIHWARRLAAADLLKEAGKGPRIWRPSLKIFWRARSATEGSSCGEEGEDGEVGGRPLVKSGKREKKRRWTIQIRTAMMQTELRTAR